MARQQSLADRHRAAIRPTTIIESPRLNQRLGCEVVIASETFQWTGSFKFRAAYNVALNVPNEHLIAASSGNFGQALAYACKLTGKRCTIVMPHDSAQVKIDGVREYGATVDLIDVRQVSRAARVEQLAAGAGDAYIASPYDDPLVIEGNSSLGDELRALGRSFDKVVVSVGGGGLISGILQSYASSKQSSRPEAAPAEVERPRGSIEGVAGAEEHRRSVQGVATGSLDFARDDVEIWGAEPLLGNDAARSLREDRLITNEQEPKTIADGARTVSLGEHNWKIIREHVAGIVEVPDEQIREGLRLLYSLANLKVEPTGALTVGALLSRPDEFHGQRVACIVSGGNVDASTYQAILSENN